MGYSVFEINNGVLEKYTGSDETVRIPDNVTEIGNWAFNGCKNIKVIYLPSKVSKVGVGAFFCKSIEKIYAPNGLDFGNTTFGCEIIYNSENWNNNTISLETDKKNRKCPGCGSENPENAKFCNNCGSELKDFSDNRPQNINNSFWERSVSVQPKTDMVPGQSGDRVCPTCNTVNSGDSNHCKKCGENLDGFSNSNWQKIENIYPENSSQNNNQNNKVKPNSFNKIGIAIAVVILVAVVFLCLYFSNQTVINSNNYLPTPPDNISKIEERETNLDFEIVQGVLVEYKGNAEKVVIPKSVTKIGEVAFHGCSSLKEITIPNSVTEIGYYAFYECSSLKEITIPNSVTEIDDGTFTFCSSLEKINVSPDNKYYSSENGVLFNIDKSKLIRYPENCQCQSYSVPNSVTELGDDAFRYCSSIKEITIPKRVNKLSGSFFNGCYQLKKITVPKGLDISQTGYPFDSKIVRY